MYERILTPTSLFFFWAMAIPLPAPAMEIGNASTSAKLDFRVIIPPVLRVTIGPHRPQDLRSMTTPSVPVVDIASHARFLSVVIAPASNLPTDTYKESAIPALPSDGMVVDAKRPSKAITLLTPRNSASGFGALHRHQMHVTDTSSQIAETPRLLYTVSTP